MPTQRPTDEWLSHAVTIRTADCIRWPFGLTSEGYPSKAAHITACAHRMGPRPDGDWEAAHSCGHRWCVNPSHLSWKTPRANGLDRIDHGSRRPLLPVDGETHPVKADVRRRYAEEGLTQQQLADEYGISQSTVSRYLHGYAYESAASVHPAA